MKHRTPKDWLVASRPWSFTASAIPVVAITAYLFLRSHHEGWTGCDWWNALLALPMLVLMQAAGNLIGDYYDHVRGIDLPGSLNQVRHIQSGMFQPREILHYGYVCLAAACLLGLVILWRCGWEAAWLGVAGVALVAGYPWLKAHALGDVDILLGYALLPALGVSYAATGQYHWEVMLLSLAPGSITVGILHANNTRDILNDTRAGITTLCISLGGVASQWIYFAEIALPYVLVPVMAVVGMVPWTAMVVFLTLPLAVTNVRRMLRAEPLAEEPIGDLDQRTAQLQMAFGVLYTLSFLAALYV